MRTTVDRQVVLLRLHPAPSLLLADTPSAMDGSHRLKELLQLQLASDAYAVLHLPFVLETLSKEDFLPSSHTPKWIARVNSLIHSKDPAAKWSGLCLAFQTAAFSRDIMLECAQSWVGAAMPLLVVRLLYHFHIPSSNNTTYRTNLHLQPKLLSDC